MTSSTDGPDTEITQGVSHIMSIGDLAIEAAAGHRAKCEAQGFSPAAAEKMGADLHDALIHVLIPAPKTT